MPTETGIVIAIIVMIFAAFAGVVAWAQRRTAGRKPHHPQPAN